MFLQSFQARLMRLLRCMKAFFNNVADFSRVKIEAEVQDYKKPCSE